MRSLNGLGIGLSLVFGFLFLALIAELYYLLWWKRRISSDRDNEDGYSSTSSSAREFFYLFCWKKPSSLSSTALNPQQLCNSVRMADTHVLDSDHLGSNSSKDFLLKPYGEDGIETELMRLHNLSGPPRFLFTIKEETKEDLESEDGRSNRGDKSRKGSRSRSLSDLLLQVDTPFMTPLASPAFFTPPLTPIDSYNHHGFNPLYESSTNAEMNSLRASPPPKFKFLKDAEEKLQRRIKEEYERRAKRSCEDDKSVSVAPPSKVKIEEDGSYITILVSKNQEKAQHYNHQHSSSSQSQLKLALSDYQVKWGTTFKCMECWDIVKEHAKWKQAVKSLEEADKRAQAQKKVIHEVAGDDDDDADAVVVQIKNKGGRPPGRGAQKAARKAAQENAAAMKSSSDTFSYYVDRLEKKDESKEKNEEIRLKLLAEQSASNDLLAQSAMKLANAIESKGKRKEIEIMKDMVTQKMLEPGALEGMSSKKKEETLAVKNKLIYHMAKWAKSCIGSSDESD